MPDVQRPRHRGRRGVDAEHLGPVSPAGTNAYVSSFAPALDPPVLEPLQRRLVRYARGCAGRGCVGSGIRNRAGHREILENGHARRTLARSAPRTYICAKIGLNRQHAH